MSDTRIDPSAPPQPPDRTGSLSGLFPETPSDTRSAPPAVKRKKKRRRVVIPVVVILVIIGVIAAAALAPRKSSTSGLLTAKAEQRTVALTAQGTGTVVDGTTVVIGSDDTWTMTERDGVTLAAAGQSPAAKVTSVSVSVGTRVTKGKTLAKVKNPDGSSTTIKSPVTGWVRASAAVKNSTVTGSLFTIGGGSLHVSVPISEYDIGKVVVGQPVSLDLQGLGETKTSEVISASATTSGSTASTSGGSASGTSTAVTDYDVVVSIPSPEKSVRVGMNAQATIQIQQVDAAIAVPIQALSEGTDGQYTVKTLDKAGKQHLTPVTLGLVGDGYAEVKSGLSNGQTVVTGSDSGKSTTSTTTPTGAGGGF